MKYLLEMHQGIDKVAQDFDDQETMMLVVQAMLEGGCEVECRIMRIKEENEISSAEEDEWEGKGESRHDG